MNNNMSFENNATLLNEFNYGNYTHNYIMIFT